MKLHTVFLAFTVAAVGLLIGGCGRHHLSLADRNRLFIERLPRDLNADTLAAVRQCVELANHPLSESHQQLAGFIKRLFEAQGAKTELAVANESWDSLAIMGVSGDATIPWQLYHNPAWPYAIVPRIVPAPTKLDPYLNGIPAGATLVLEAVPIEQAGRTPYRMDALSPTP